MEKEELQKGDAVCLNHSTQLKYTYLGEWMGGVPISHRVKDAKYGVFAYNLAQTGELVTVVLPLDSVTRI